MTPVKLTNVLLNVLDVCNVVLSPVTFALLVAIHVYVAGELAVKGIETVPPLQIVAVLALVITGPAAITAENIFEGSF
ncbi:hypothetical protein FLTE109939_14575 [Flavobacterium terrigena]